ncbi:helix-turn-helix domain-containing protein [Kribbella sp. NPDC051770]|uniref:helix-turn-helix domain-containing protein n=1 Tax=Kribbella sp. NPDC051770 TaxID=3155413 RepID=UPI00342FB9C2
MRIHTVRELGSAVREARARHGLTQVDLARRAGVSREWLVRLEQGHARLEVQLVLDTLEAVGLTLTTADSEQFQQDETEAAWDEVFTTLADKPSTARPQRDETSDNG